MRAAAARSYTVERGDNLSKIAKRFYGDANQWRRIFEANRDQIDNPDLIHVGQELLLPGEGDKTHIVKPGESLGRIAVQYGVSVASLVAANSLSNPDFLRIGQRLVVKVGGASALPPPRFYLVQRGDTLAAISRKFGVPVKTLMEANGITDAAHLYYGTRLRLSGSGFVAAPAPTTSTHTVARGETAPDRP